MQIIQPPRVEQRPEKAYVGIRIVTPFRGMLRARDELLAELYRWLTSHDFEPAGPFFLRLHVIEMEGPMDLEVGVVTTRELGGDDRVRPGVLPAGGYATLTYVDHARRANKALIDWARENGVAFDRWDEPSGDAFACRYEAYITDPRREPRKTKWEVELNIRVVLWQHESTKTCGSLLAALDVHPRVAMQILRHSKIAVTMEIYTEVPSAATRDALKKLGEWLGS